LRRLDPANTIVIDTTKGRIVIKLRPDLAPKHAERIKSWRAKAITTMCRSTGVIDGFMAQTGDGKNFDGTGGSKYPNLPAEFSTCLQARHRRHGAYQRSQSANSQFFIMFADGSALNGQ